MNYRILCPHCGQMVCECSELRPVPDCGPDPCPPEGCPCGSCPDPCPPGPCPEPCPPAGECPPSGICNMAYGQIGLISNAVSGRYISMFETARAGSLIRIEENDTLVLQAGYVYYVSYNVLAVPESNSYFQTVPYVNGSIKLSYATFSPTNGVWRNVSAANGFLVTEALEEEARLQIRLDYPGTVRNIDLTGALSVFPVAVPQDEGRYPKEKQVR